MELSLKMFMKQVIKVHALLSYRGLEMAQLLMCLPCKHENLSSIPKVSCSDVPL